MNKSTKTPKQPQKQPKQNSTTRISSAPRSVSRKFKKIALSFDRKSQTLSDLLTYRLFPSRHRSPTELVKLHQDLISTLCATIPSQPLSPQSISLFSLQQLHKANYQFKCLQGVLARAGNNSQALPVQSSRPPSLPSKYSTTPLSPFIVTRDNLTHAIHVPPNTTFADNSPPSTHATTFSTTDLAHLLDTFVAHTIPTSLLPIIEAIDEHYFDSHLQSVMHFTSPYSTLVHESREYNSVFSTHSDLELPDPLAFLAKPTAAPKKPSTSSLFSRSPPTTPKKPQPQIQPLTLLPFLHSLQHSRDVSTLALQRSPIFAHMKPARRHPRSDASIHPHPDPHCHPLRPAVDLHITEQSSAHPSVASFTASYSVVKPNTRASHTSNANHNGDFSSRFDPPLFPHLSPLGFSLPRPSFPAPKSKQSPTTSPLAARLQAKSRKLNSRGKRKPRSTQMARERQGFLEFAFIPPIVAPHHTALATRYMARFNKSSPSSRPAASSQALCDAVEPTGHIKYADNNPDPTSERKTHNANFFKNYPTKSTFRLTFERRSIRSLFANRPILSPIQYNAIESVFNQPLPLSQFPSKSRPSSPLTYSSLLLAFSERRRCIFTPQSLADITLLDCPTLLVHFNSLLSTVLKSLPQHILKEVEHELTHGLALCCATTEAEQNILTNAFAYTFNHFAQAETPRNRKRSMTTQDLRQQFINAIYLPEGKSAPSSQNATTQAMNAMTMAPRLKEKDLLYHVQGLPLLSGLQGMISILQHELLHAAMFIHTPQLWTTTTDRPATLPGPLKTTQNQREVVDLVQHRYQYAIDRLPYNPYSHTPATPPTHPSTAPLANSTSKLPSSSSSSTTTTPEACWRGNVLPALLKTKTPNYFWPRRSVDETAFTWKSSSLKTSHISGLSLNNDESSDDEPTPRTYMSSISSHQDGHSLAFRLLARNLFGHNKINVSLDTQSSFLQQ